MATKKKKLAKKTAKKPLLKARPKSAPKAKTPVLSKKSKKKAPTNPKALKAKAPSQYRDLRKWTLPKLEAFLTNDAATVRSALGTVAPEAAVSAADFISFLKAQEKAPAAWRTARGTKLGRPRGKRVDMTPPPAVVDPTETLRRLAAGGAPKAPVTPKRFPGIPVSALL